MNTLPPIATAPTATTTASATAANATSAATADSATNSAESSTANTESTENGFSAMLAKKLRGETKNKTGSDSTQDAAALLMADSAQIAATPTAVTAIDPALAALMANTNLANSADAKPAGDSAALLSDASAKALNKPSPEASTLVEKSLAKTKTKDASKAEAGSALATETTADTPSNAAHARGDKAGLAAALNTALNAGINAKGHEAELPNAKSAPTFDLAALTHNNATPAFHALSGTANATASGVTPMVSTTLTTPVQSATWGNELVQQIKQFVLEGIGVAELHLNPQELGPIRVEIALDNKQAAIHFSAQNADTRDALNQNFARLRDSLADAGLNLQNASTGSFADSQAFNFMQQQRERGTPGSNYRGSNLSNSPEDIASNVIGALNPSSTTRSRSGVDLFA